MLEGELLLEPLALAAYSHDASLFEVEPTGVVVPRSVDDLIQTVRYASENGLSVHARGSGTSTSGGTLGPGLIVDFSRYFRRVVSIEHDRVVVQPGLVLDELNACLAPIGRRIGPDPPGSSVGTIGGMVGLDAAGPRSLRYGSTGDHVERLGVVFANGETGSLGFETWPAFDSEPEDFQGVVVRKLGALVRRNLDLLVRHSPRSTRGSAGYALGRAASGLGVHLPRLIVGSEGTLALVHEITLRTVPIPAAQCAAVVPFSRLGDAAASVADTLDASPAVCDLFDWRSIRLAREVSPHFREWIAESAEAVLILLFEGDDPHEVAARCARTVARLSRSGRLAADATTTAKRSECEQMLDLRRVVEPLLSRSSGLARPAAFLDEVVVPPEQLGEMILRLQAVMREHDVNWMLDAQAAHGRLHPRPFLDPSDPVDLARLEPLATAVLDAALQLGGGVSGEGVFGAARDVFLRRQFGDLFPVYREIKDAFDPLNVLNPGRVVGDDPGHFARSLRRLPPVTPPVLEIVVPPGSGETSALPDAPAVAPGGILPVLRWESVGLVDTATACNGCGVCRSNEPTTRMCPTSRATHSETTSPRTKANLVRQIASGALDPKLWGSEELKESAALCIHCNMCPKECPSKLDVSSLMLEAKAAYVESHGMAPGEWVLSRVELWSRIASRLPILAHAVLKNHAARWALDRLFGLSRMRRLPKPHRTPFTRRARRLGLTRPRPHEPGPRVVYFVDVYANYYDQELAESVVSLLRHAGVNVFVPSGQRDSGMPSLVAGDVDHARDLALVNLRVLGNAVRDGYTVVCSEPTSALMLRQEYLKLTDDLDAALVAANTLDVGTYLAGLSDRGQLAGPTHPLRARVGYHQPCHLRALDVGTPGLDLIRRIPEIDVEFIDRGCSGMAGTFGLRSEHFRTSLRAGRNLLRRLRDDDIEIGSTECSACRMQMEQGSTKHTVHPIKLLSLGYGLNPALRQRLREAKPRHEVS